MTRDEIRQGNDLIATYMGYQIHSWKYPDKSTGVLYHTGNNDFKTIWYYDDWSDIVLADCRWRGLKTTNVRLNNKI